MKSQAGERDELIDALASSVPALSFDAESFMDEYRRLRDGGDYTGPRCVYCGLPADLNKTAIFGVGRNDDGLLEAHVGCHYIRLKARLGELGEPMHRPEWERKAR